MTSPAMTKDELALAQFLLGTAERAEKWADQLDPERKHDDKNANELEGIASKAAHLFSAMFGRHFSKVTSFELNTEHPGDWTKLPYDERAQAPGGRST